MATLRTVTRSTPVSNFSQAPAAPSPLFGILADAMDAAYETLEPIAVSQMQVEGDSLGRSMANTLDWQRGRLIERVPQAPAPYEQGGPIPSGMMPGGTLPARTGQPAPPAPTGLTPPQPGQAPTAPGSGQPVTPGARPGLPQAPNADGLPQIGGPSPRPPATPGTTARTFGGRPYMRVDPTRPVQGPPAPVGEAPQSTEVAPPPSSVGRRDRRQSAEPEAAVIDEAAPTETASPASTVSKMDEAVILTSLMNMAGLPLDQRPPEYDRIITEVSQGDDTPDEAWAEAQEMLRARGMPASENDRFGGGGDDALDGGQGNDRFETSTVPGINFSRYEREFGLPPEYLGRTAWIESRGRPDAKNPNSSATGLFQFINSTARAYGLTNRFDPVASTEAAARLARDNAAQLRRVLGRDPTGAELYLAHQQGGGGAAKLLANPNASAASIVGRDAVRLNGGNLGMTAGEFAGLWLRKYEGSRKVSGAGIGSTTGSTRSGPDFTPILYDYQAPMIRGSDGRLKQALYMPSSSPILQAHNASAMAAYNAEVLGRGAEEFLTMRRGYQGDPEGFRKQAEAFVDDLVELAPEEFRVPLRERLSSMAQQQVLGAMSEHHDETQRRANNATRALSDRYALDYEDAVAAGNAEAADAARANLTEVLRSREALPGAAWTPEQSANVLRDAERRAARRQARRAQAQRAEWNDQWDTVIAAAERYGTSKYDSLLSNPAAIAANPEKAREAGAKSMLRDMAPEFLGWSPDEQRAEIERLEAQPIGAEWELDLIDASKDLNRLTEKGLEDDPIAWAEQHFPIQPPPLPQLSPENMDEYVSGLRARREYGDQMQVTGHVDVPAYLTNAESDDLSTALSADTPADLQAVVAGALVSGLGDASPRVIQSLDAPAEVKFAGRMLASGVSPNVAVSILKGREMIAAGTASPPNGRALNATITEHFGDAFAGIDVGARGDLGKAASALYAANTGGAKLDEAGQQEAIIAAVQQAAGQTTDRRGRLLGGIQEVNGTQTLLPPNVNGEMVTQALRDALALQGNFITEAYGTDDEAVAFDWSEVANSPPMIEGMSLADAGVGFRHIQVVPTRNGRHMLRIRYQGSETDVRSADGGLFEFSMDALLEASR
ncbi:hypothetical protein JANAI62_03680 [Jannaschia pagri]|uniref:Transglycosylase SLT domain-containing protein n=1 Tax=Jannaschia pagri TaxID=2829797 RepID=A0ABQ4NH57_9RHOB|nr:MULTISPECIES: transglycosylase SLT domain-containing protein [unclassified Jannaschia]GIT90149.1 hypothetical protein JANAI61_06070 [Jannaschia sp. AI_61]GIT93745.1 hypothetical protein JANAI62_03680 [Jannaschia sp. AI_62]